MNYELLSNTPLFAGFSPTDIQHILQCLQTHTQTYNKGQLIYHNGQNVNDVCVVLSGCVQIENNDILGNKSILGIIETGDIFAESYACIPHQPILVDVISQEISEILFISISSLFMESKDCCYSHKLILNLLRISSRKNLHLSMRIFHSAPKTIRARLYSYFSEQISLQTTSEIVIPLDRQQLADYLGVERTALSKELGKMRREGLIEFHKNRFKIITK